MSQRGRPHPHTYQAIALEAYGPLPVACRCGNLVYEFSRTDGVVHHKDEDPFNNAPENLEIMCKSCHGSIHNAGKVLTDEHKAKLRKPKPDGFGDKVRAHTTGRPKTTEELQKISNTLKGRRVGAALLRAKCSCGKEGGRGPIARHAKLLGEGHEWSPL